MQHIGGRQPRLRVSAMAAMANPSAKRIDTWHQLDDATRQLARVHRAGLDVTREAAWVRRLLSRLAAYERFWLYPGADNLAMMRRWQRHQSASAHMSAQRRSAARSRRWLSPILNVSVMA